MLAGAAAFAVRVARSCAVGPPTPTDGDRRGQEDPRRRWLGRRPGETTPDGRRCRTTPDEIRASIEQNRAELGTSLERLRGEVGAADRLALAAAAPSARGDRRRRRGAGFVVGRRHRRHAQRAASAASAPRQRRAVVADPHAAAAARSRRLLDADTTASADPADPEQPGPDVSADHRADLGDEPGRSRRSRVPRATSAWAWSGPGCAGPSSRRRRPPASAREQVDHPLERAPATVRTRSIGVISDSTIRIGLIFKAEPSHAWAPPIRPPRRRYSSVSIENHISSSARARRAPGRRPRRRRRRLAPPRRRPARIRPSPPHAVAESTTCTRSAARPELVAGLLGGADGSGHAPGEVDRDDLVAAHRAAARTPPGSHRSTAARSSAARWTYASRS